MRRTRRLTLTVGIVALAALILLSGGVAQLRLAPGSQLPAVADEEARLEREPGGIERLDDSLVELLFRILVVLVPVLLAASIIALIVSPEMRKDFVQRLVLPLLILLMLLVLREKPEEIPQPPPSAVPAESGSQVVGETVPEVRFDANPPETVIWGTRIAVGIGAALLIGGALWLLWRSRRPPAPRPLAQVAEQARRAIRSIEAGADVRNAILLCYFEMSRILGEEKGLTRQSTMTPREFERSLAAAGLPGPAVQRLTRLFESVRYGAKATGAGEEQEAKIALAEISDACRSGA